MNSGQNSFQWRIFAGNFPLESLSIQLLRVAIVSQKLKHFNSLFNRLYSIDSIGRMRITLAAVMISVLLIKHLAKWPIQTIRLATCPCSSFLKECEGGIFSDKK